MQRFSNAMAEKNKMTDNFKFLH